MYPVLNKSHKPNTLLKNEIKIKNIFKCLANHDSFILLVNGPRCNIYSRHSSSLTQRMSNFSLVYFETFMYSSYEIWLIIAVNFTKQSIKVSYQFCRSNIVMPVNYVVLSLP